LQRNSDSARVVIDPSALDDVPGWTQADYRAFWGEVIERYAAEVIFRDGWSSSRGCAYEFLVAARAGIPTLDAVRRPLSLLDALGMIRSASYPPIRAIEDPDDGFLAQIANDLDAIIRSRTGETR
jgi:hypothetical protein